MFKIQDYIVCPGHGVAKVYQIESREVNGQKINFYILEVLLNKMKIMIPDTESALRPLANKDQINDVYKLLENHEVSVDTSTWLKRYTLFSKKLRTGSVLEIAEVFHQIMLSKKIKTLAFGERKMLDQCKDLLTTELSLSLGDYPDSVSEKLVSFYK